MRNGEAYTESRNCSSEWNHSKGINIFFLTKQYPYLKVSILILIWDINISIVYNEEYVSLKGFCLFSFYCNSYCLF